MVQAILGTRSNLVGQGTAVGEPLGARQVAVMILGVVPICCRIPARRLSVGKIPVPGVEGWQVPGASRSWPDVLYFRMGSGHEEGMTVSVGPFANQGGRG